MSWPDTEDTARLRRELASRISARPEALIIDELIQARIRQYDNRVASDLKKALEDGQA
jgi:hypothetical protein